ncbi:unnamed protein product [Rangifer tarandus platyrhynchus]|uniref:Uncharacterized protein n=1 Tax=Rangifer tarandus platyrhynchus TaxID=3082113 RepID=A0AC60A3T0_RANTA
MWPLSQPGGSARRARAFRNLRLGRTLPGLRGPGVTTRVSSEQVFLVEDTPQLAVEVRSPTPSRTLGGQLRLLLLLPSGFPAASRPPGPSSERTSSSSPTTIPETMGGFISRGSSRSSRL